ncbi:tRNA (adenosine(37)-N6)-dimethylallyltransferase MiaA [Falsihalocynthiibacter sp. S25ZX9]|uniref:tRNA (adenosine(37)-N6)-dimethylallyltransferase MiaA n=1 Tax=Falsihalocynthiibacter sp. S25ZX9 TaxID=3240870 RepID=UPI00350E9933
MLKIHDISPDLPVLIAGPTASGKSALALEIVAAQGGVILNADALQVFGGWNILTARPMATDMAAADHQLYGHVAYDAPYSVGHWLRDITPLLAGKRPVIVGGTGLYFQALTQGLALIPATPDVLRETADTRRLSEGHDGMFAELDAQTQARIDALNPMRVQRAWEVQQATGLGLAHWQDQTPPPLLPLANTYPIVFDADRDWLAARIERRFHLMIEAGAIEEARAMWPTWNPAHQSSKAIGAPELIAHLEDRLSLEAAIEAAIISSRQYAKRQRTWFRSKMRDWNSHVPH